MAARRRVLLGVLGAVLVASGVGAWAIRRATDAPAAAPVIVDRKSKTMERYRAELTQRYGKPLYSFHDEETLIRDFFQDERGGYFVDVGASHYEKLSNTYYLEKNLGWRGIGIDAQQKYAADYARFRPNTKYLVYFVGPKEKAGRQVDFFVDNENEYTSTGLEASVAHPSTKVVVPSTTIDDLLEREGVDKVDFVSMDIEDSEPGALAGFTIQRWKPRLLCVEMHPVVVGDVLDYFRRAGYVMLESYSRIDALNGFFTPADGPGARRDRERMRALEEEYRRELGN